MRLVRKGSFFSFEFRSFKISKERRSKERYSIKRPIPLYNWVVFAVIKFFYHLNDLNQTITFFVCYNQVFVKTKFFHNQVFRILTILYHDKSLKVYQNMLLLKKKI